MLGLNLEQITQMGGVGIAVLMVGYSLAKDKMFNKTLNNHLNHFADALDRNSKVIGGNTEVIKNCKKALDRVEHSLDRQQR